MKNKSIKMFLAMCLCSVMLAGCGGVPLNSLNQHVEKHFVEIPDSPERQGEPGAGDGTSEIEYVSVKLNGSCQRAAYLADMVYAENDNANTIVSPLSLDMALGLVSGGAKGQTKEELTTYLGTEDYGAFAAQYMEYAKGLNTNPSESVPMGYNKVYEIANSIWVKNDRKLVDNYVKKAREQYDAEIAAVSFEKNNLPETMDQINTWCSEKTHELIPEIISEEAFTDKTVAVLVNSLYFEAAWKDKWGLVSESFTNFDGTVTEQEMLRDTLTTYYENDHATAFAKGYSNGMSFIGILPKESGEFALADLDVESLLESESTEYDVNALMPKLNFDTTAENIVDILKAQGVETVFDEERSDLTGLLEMKPYENTYVSDIIQKSKIELDENGTKAAAVTSVIMEMKNTAMQEQKEVKQVHLDRPFAFMIYDEVNEQIVFMGKVVTIKQKIR